MEELKPKVKKVVQFIITVVVIALIITIVFSYDEKIKCRNNKGFLLATV